MRRRHLVARVLVALYPSDWRREYGPELTDILASRALTPGVIADVVRGAVWQRLRASRPSTILGVASMSFILGMFVLTPTNTGRHWTALLQPAATTFPPSAFTFVTAEVYTFCLIACGYWTRRRYAAPLHRSGTAAMRMSLIAGLPLIVCALLMMLGVVDLTILGVQRIKLLPWVMMMSPLLRLPEAWIWGVAGGLLGRWFSRSRQPAVLPLS